MKNVWLVSFRKFIMQHFVLNPQKLLVLYIVIYLNKIQLFIFYFNYLSDFIQKFHICAAFLVKQSAVPGLFHSAIENTSCIY